MKEKGIAGSKLFLQEVAAHQQCVLCGNTAPLSFGKGRGGNL